MLWQDVLTFPGWVREPHKMDEPIVYQICVEGLLNPKWSAWFEGFSVVQNGENTVITGSVPDQAALHGLLGMVRDLGLLLLYVNRLPGGR